MREIRFNVGGDPKEDKPYIQPDRDIRGNTPQPIPLIFELGSTPPNRALASIPPYNTGGADVYYQNSRKMFRIILPPVDKEFQNEAGEPPQLPPEYGGDADKVALHYGPVGRSGLVRLDRNVWVDDGGAWRPKGAPQLYAVGAWHRGQGQQVQDNFTYIGEHGGDVVRILGMVNWAGEEIDPRWPDYPQTLDAVFEAARSAGLRVHFTVTGGGGNPYGGAQIMIPVLDRHREDLLVIEAVNEENASTDDAVRIVQLLKPLGVPISCGLGNTGLQNINQANSRAGANVGILHEERSTDVNRNDRQCWDFRLLEGAPACSEPQGPASSVAEETVPFNIASLRACRIICGAGYFLMHEGHGVFGRTYPYNANTPPGEIHSDTRFANLRDVPSQADYFAAMANAERHLPTGCENWAKFNSGQPIVVPAGNVNKIYGCMDGGRFCEAVIGAEGGITLRADRPCHLTVVNPATDDVLFDGRLAQGQQASVGGLRTYVLVGEIG